MQLMATPFRKRDAEPRSFLQLLCCCIVSNQSMFVALGPPRGTADYSTQYTYTHLYIDMNTQTCIHTDMQRDTNIERCRACSLDSFCFQKFLPTFFPPQTPLDREECCLMGILIHSSVDLGSPVPAHAWVFLPPFQVRILNPQHCCNLSPTLSLSLPPHC